MSPWEAAELLERLPASSRLVRALNPGSEWPDEKVYMARIEFWLHALLWGLASSKGRGKRPEPLVPDSMKDSPNKRQIRGVARPLAEIDALFPVKQKTE